MKKLLVFSSSSVGGAERMTVTVTKTLDSKKFKVVYYLVDMLGTKQNTLLDFIPKDLPVHIIPKANPISIMWKCIQAVRREKPDVVFSSLFYLNNKLLLWRRFFLNICFVIRCENYIYTYSKKQQLLLKRVYRNADMIIAQTDEMKLELTQQMRLDEQKIVVLQNPIDKETIDRKIGESTNPYPEDGKIRFVASGRFVFQKGFDMLIQAFAKVERQLPKSELYVLGRHGEDDDEIYCQVRDLIAANGLSEKVHVVGHQDNPYQYVKHANCFVLSSRWEGLPNVLIEALYLRTPVAAFKCIPVIERIVCDGKNGYMAEAEDVSQLADAMLKAAQLTDIENTYNPAQLEDFHYMFEHCAIPPHYKIGGGVKLIVKKLLRKTFVYKWKTDLENRWFAKKRAPYLNDLKTLLGSKTSIISSNCFTGRIMQDLKMEYNSPTLGLWMMPDDFAVFCGNLKHYLNADIRIVAHSKNELGEYKMTHPPKHPYPVGWIDGKLEVHFLHYHTAEEAISKWKRRAQRVNYGNILLIGSEQNGCTEEDIKAFNAIPYPRKLYFCSKPYPYECVVYIKEFEKLGYAGDPYKQGHIFYKYLVEWLKKN